MHLCILSAGNQSLGVHELLDRILSCLISACKPVTTQPALDQVSIETVCISELNAGVNFNILPKSYHPTLEVPYSNAPLSQ